VRGNPFLMYWAKNYGGTEPELAMEPAIAALGTPYRFQHPFWGQHAIADFVLLKHKVILEVDGKEHRTLKGKREDAARTALLNKRGWTVVRCTNEEALEDPYEVVERLIKPLLKDSK
jgi:very-short-patch-repair endonuclease